MALHPFFDVVEVPATRTVYEDEAAFRAVPLDDARAFAVTSARAARAAAVLWHRRPNLPVYAVGESTAQALRDEGVIVTAVAPARTGASLATLVDEGPVVVPGAAEPLTELDDALAARGIVVRRVTAYRTLGRVLDDEDRQSVQSAQVVLVIAPSAWAILEPCVAAGTLVVTMGPTTAAVVRASHRHVVVATTPEAMAQAWRAFSAPNEDH